MKTQSPCRFCRIYALGVLAFAVLVGAVMPVQMRFGSAPLAGYEAVRIVTLSAVKVLAPAATGSALLVAFVVWAHPLSIAQLQSELPRLLKRALLVSLPGYFVAALAASGVALLVSHLAFGVPWSAGSVALRSSTAGDWAAGAFSALADASLVVFLAWRFLVRLQASPSSLAMKLVLAWTFATGLRVTWGVLSALLLPA